MGKCGSLWASMGSYEQIWVFMKNYGFFMGEYGYL